MKLCKITMRKINKLVAIVAVGVLSLVPAAAQASFVYEMDIYTGFATGWAMTSGQFDLNTNNDTMLTTGDFASWSVTYATPGGAIMLDQANSSLSIEEVFIVDPVRLFLAQTPGQTDFVFRVTANADPAREVVWSSGGATSGEIRLSSSSGLGNKSTIVLPFGEVNVATAVPEPATMTLLALGGLTLLRRRKRTA